jgi:hypothetical protein
MSKPDVDQTHHIARQASEIERYSFDKCGVRKGCISAKKPEENRRKPKQHQKKEGNLLQESVYLM